MADLNRLMKDAADAPDDGLDMNVLLRRGQKLRFRRAIGASSLALTIMTGGALAALEVSDDGSAPTERDRVVAPARSPAEAECEDKDRNSDGDHVRYCIARGVFENEEWKWYAYFNSNGELCESLLTSTQGGGGCGGRLRSTKAIQVGGLSGWDGAGPLLDVVTEENVSRAFVETSKGERLPIQLFDAPHGLGVPQRYGLYFDLPKDAERVVAVNDDGEVLGEDGLDFLVTATDGKGDPLEDVGGADGVSISFDSIEGEPWSLSSRFPSGDAVPCLTLGLGNDPKAADVEISAQWCPESDDVADIHAEQVWWVGLKERAPIFGTIPQEAASAQMEFDDGTGEVVRILESPEDGMWPEPTFATDFVVAFPPVGARGQLVARADDGTVLSTWNLCLDPPPGELTSAACSNTMFWTPPE